MKKKFLLLVLALVMVFAGSYFYKTSAQKKSPPPQCTCQYPNGGGYGTLQPIDPPVDGSKYTCQVNECYLLIGDIPKSGGEY